MRPRDLPRLAATSYDVLIVGGGITGLACAYEFASRGARTALVEASDFGSAASFNHQKTAHGGLRSLQSLSLARAREAIRERRALARIAPAFLRPLPFLVGTYRSATRNRLALRAAFAIDRALSRDRNDGLEPELHLPPPRLVSRTAVTRLFPGIRTEGLTGGAQWYDYQMAENDRLTFAFAAAADSAGADLATYAAVHAIEASDGRVTGARVRDALGGDVFDVRARAIVNAAGAGAGTIMRLFGVERPFPLLRAINLVTSKPARDLALAAPDATGRMLTLVPWRDGAIVGTGHSPAVVSDASLAGPSEAEIDSFIAQANVAFPALRLTASEVTLVHGGLVPAVVRRDGSADLAGRSAVIDHAGDGTAGAFTLVAAKYTTARALAERCAGIVGRRIGLRLSSSRTAVTSLPGASISDHEGLAIEEARRRRLDLPISVLKHLASRYGEAAGAVVRLIEERPELARPLAPSLPTVGAEVVHAIRHEAALRLGDIVLRRTTAGAARHPGGAALDACARIAAAELGWDPARMGREIEDVSRVYPTRGRLVPVTAPGIPGTPT
jgi:glycerol-3-phosphate dehydrogenase